MIKNFWIIGLGLGLGLSRFGHETILIREGLIFNTYMYTIKVVGFLPFQSKKEKKVVGCLRSIPSKIILLAFPWKKKNKKCSPLLMQYTAVWDVNENGALGCFGPRFLKRGLKKRGLKGARFVVQVAFVFFFLINFFLLSVTLCLYFIFLAKTY